MARPFKSSDKGKRVVTNDGDEIGRVADVDGDEAHVTPESGLADSIRKRLGMDENPDEMYVLNNSEVATFADDEIHLRN